MSATSPLPFRKLIFWLHLASGVVAGAVVLIMSFTGVLLTYEKQMIAWADSGYRAAPPTADAARKPLEETLATVSRQFPANPSSITLRNSPERPIEFGFGREGVVYANPYTGQVLGEGSKDIRAFFQSMTSWHRWLGREGPGRATARAITGACNLAFLFLVMSGLYLWWPRQWTARHLKPILWFRSGLGSKARDFNWHNVIGFWCLVPLFFVVLTGVVMSYPWANNLLFRMTGSPVPAGREGGPPRGGDGPLGGPGGERGEARRGGEGPGEGARDGARRRGGPPDGQLRAGAAGGERPSDGRRGEGPRAGRRGDGPRGEGAREGRRGEERGAEGPRGAERAGSSGSPANWSGLDQLMVRAEQQVAEWKTITLRLPPRPGRTLAFAIDWGNGARPDQRGTLTLNRQTGEAAAWETYADNSAGRNLRTWVRWTHTGEAGGWIGQTIAGIASLGGVVLVWTGIALAYRRFTAWLARRRRQPSGNGADSTEEAVSASAGAAGQA